MIEWFQQNLGFSPWKAIFFAGLIFLLRLAIKHFFKSEVEITKHKLSNDLELTKNKLAQEGIRLTKDLDREIEAYKNQLEVLRLQNQIQFSKLHEKRFEVVDAIYKKLVRLHLAMGWYTSLIKPRYENPDEEAKQEVIEVNDAFKDYRSYFLNNKLYFDKNINSLLEKLMKDYWDNLYDYESVARMKSYGATHQEMKGDYEKAKKAGENIRNEIPKILEKLEEEFQILLGVIENKKPEEK